MDSLDAYIKTKTLFTIFILLNDQNIFRNIDIWQELEHLLFPYLVYSLRTDPAVTTGGRISKRSNRLMKRFIASNLPSEAACMHALRTLETYGLELQHDWMKTRLEFERFAETSAEVQSWRVRYRRLGKNRLQACCSLGGDIGLDFTWENNTPLSPTLDYDEISFRLRRFGFTDSDDEEHYWRPWEQSLEDAELDYRRFQEQDYKAELVHLDVSDLDWASVSTAADEHPYEQMNNLVLRDRDATHYDDDDYSDTPLPKIIKGTGGHNHHGNGSIPKKQGHIYNHHSDYVNPDPDYEEDYSYIQSHPVFAAAAAPTNGVAAYATVGYDDDDDDDIFNVCHGLPPPAPTLLETSVTKPEEPVKNEPHLQCIIGGDDDLENDYWYMYFDYLDYLLIIVREKQNKKKKKQRLTTNKIHSQKQND